MNSQYFEKMIFAMMDERDATADVSKDIDLLPKEKWRHINGYPNYRISNMGRVVSNFVRGDNRGTTGRWHFLKPNVGIHGYLTVAPRSISGKKTVLVHVLVLEAFVGARPAGMVTCHYNGQRDDARLENLRWDTEKANADDQIRHGTRPLGEQKKQAKFTDYQARQVIRLLQASKMSQKEIAALVGVTQGLITAIKTGREFMHISAELNYPLQQPRQKTSRFRGVHWAKKSKKWQAQLRVNGKLVHLGLFENEIDAAKAYDVHARLAWGKRACTNFVAKEDMMNDLEMCDAFELGRLDALDGKPCRSGQYEGLLDQAQYALGYDSVENTLELESWMEDVEFTRWGGN